jgi:outer membrane protein OmpA-like peptidoglycan-associated protein
VTGAWITTGALAFFAFSGGALAGAFGGMSGLRWGPLMVAGLVWACSLFITPPAAWFAAEKAPAAAEAPAAQPAPAVKAAEDAAKAAAAKAEAEKAAAAKAAAAKAEDEAKAAAAKAEADAKAVAAKAEADAKAAAAKAEEEAKAAALKAEEAAKEAAAKAEEEAKEAAAKAAAAAAPVSVKKLAELKAAAIAAAKALPATGPLDLGQCQTALSGLIAKENVKFDAGSAKVSKASAALIAKIGATLGRCPDSVSVEVSGHTDSSGDAAKNKALSQSRAQAVVDLLKAKGAKADQLTAVGYGPEKPLASNDTNDGKAANRRIEFAVK